MKIKLAENIKNFRKENSFTQEQLAEILGVTVGAVYKWEAGLSTPEIRLIMMLADVFGVSVDVLLGYEQQNGNVENCITRIKEYVGNQNFTDAVSEIEKALKKYPNHFELVYTSGLFYQLKFITDKEEESLERANALLRHAITLLYQNTDKSINEVSILNLIAQNYLLAEKTELALENLKQNNVCGINNSLIGVTYARMLKQPKEAMPYLTKSFADCLGDLIRTMTGYIYVYDELKNYEMEKEALNWFETLLDSLKKDDAQNAFTDMIKPVILAQSAVAEAKMGRDKQSKRLIEEAFRLAKQFDAAPVHNLQGIKFFEEEEDAVVYVDIGNTAMEAVCTLWEEFEK